MNTMQVLDPLGTRGAGRIQPARRGQLSRGARLGLLCNGKPNAPLLLATLAAALAERHGLVAGISLDKQLGADGAGRPCPPAWLDELAATSQAVLVASGD